VKLRLGTEKVFGQIFKPIKFWTKFQTKKHTYLSVNLVRSSFISKY
jgi:hypothetical protein